MKNRVAKASGGELYYEEAGDGHPLVLLHAGGMDSRMWDDQFELFSKYFRVIRYDFPGTRGSQIPTEPFCLCEDLHDLLSALRIDRAYLAGASLGGRTAIDFTLEYPEQVAALVLAAPGFSGYSFSQAYIDKFVKIVSAFKDGGPASLVWAFLQDPTLAPPPEYESARRKVELMITENFAVFFLDPALWREVGPSASDRLSEITIPTLIMIGERDDADLHEIAKMLSQGIHDSRLIEIADAGHLVNLEKPSQFNKEVLEFLRSI